MKRLQIPIVRESRLIPKNLASKTDPLNWNEPNYADMGPQFYTVVPGDTLEKIAVSIYGDVEAAETLARFNGLMSTEHSLRAGHILKLPPYMVSHNKAGMARPYQQLKAIMLGHLAPYIVFPQPKKPHQDIFGNLVKLIALAVIIYTAPILAGHLLGSAALLGTAGAAALSSTDIIVTAMVAALEDAVVQGVAIGVGIQQSKFSFAEALETGITAGLGLTLGAKTMEEIAQSALKIGTTATATQLIEMKAGLRDKFDARGVALQVSAYLASAGINKVMGNSASHVNAAAKNVVSTGVNAVLGHAITGAPISIQNIAANAIGSTIGDELGEELAESLSTPSHSSRPATRAAAARKQQQRQPSHHEMAEERLDFELDNPVLPLDKASYQLSEMNRGNLKSFKEWIAQDVNEDANRLFEEVKNIASHPLTSLVKTDLSLLRAAGTLLFNPGKIGEQLYNETRTFYNTYNAADKATQRRMQARATVSAGEELLLTVGTGAIGRFSRFTLFAERAEKLTPEVWGRYRVERDLPRDPKTDFPIPDVNKPHSQIGQRQGRNGTYTQAREWGYDANEKLVHKKDIDFTDHGRPDMHPNPHQHTYIPNATGGTMKRNKIPEPLQIIEPQLPEEFSINNQFKR